MTDNKYFVNGLLIIAFLFVVVRTFWSARLVATTSY